MTSDLPLDDPMQLRMRATLGWVQFFAGGAIAFGIAVLQRPTGGQAAVIDWVLAGLFISATGCVIFTIQYINQLRHSRRIPSHSLPAIRFKLDDANLPWPAKRHWNIVLVTGYFDVLHAGHITFLQDSKRDGEILVAGAHSDDLTRQEKGHNRPKNTVDHRLVALAGIGCVDYVFEADCFYDTQDNRMLKIIKPDYIVLSAGKDDSLRKRETRGYLARGASTFGFEVRTVMVREPIVADESKVY